MILICVFPLLNKPAAALVAAGEMEAAVQAYISALQYNPVSSLDDCQWAIRLQSIQKAFETLKTKTNHRSPQPCLGSVLRAKRPGQSVESSR